MDILKVLRSYLGRQNTKLLFPKSGQNLPVILIGIGRHPIRGPLASEWQVSYFERIILIVGRSEGCFGVRIEQERLVRRLLGSSSEER